MLNNPWRLALLLYLSASVSLCDVIELKTGERLQGTFKQATAAGVVIEAGGQPITMPLEKVRAIYFGEAPVGLPARIQLQKREEPASSVSAPQTSGAREALDALKALKSLMEIGANFRDFSQRVVDTKAKVDPFLRSAEQKDAPGGNFIAFAMEKFENAARLWGERIANPIYRGYGVAPEVTRILSDAATDVDQAEFRMNEAAKKAADAPSSKPAK